MGKWYKTGFQEAIDGLPIDPPWRGGNPHHEDYKAGYYDGQRQLDANARAEASAADHIDGYDRDDIGESPDW